MTYDTAPEVITPGYEMRPVAADTLRCRVDLYDSVIRVTNFQADTSTTRLVDPEELADAFTNRHRTTSPLLPENALWWSNSSYGTAIATWEPPLIRRVAMSVNALEVPERLNLPMPGMLYVCVPGKPPWIFASPERPTSPEQRLYHAPTFNTFSNGSTCPGSNQYPLRHDQIPESFWQSFFTFAGHGESRSRRHYDNLWNLWQELNDQPQYPDDDLIPAITVAQAMRLP